MNKTKLAKLEQERLSKKRIGLSWSVIAGYIKRDAGKLFTILGRPTQRMVYADQCTEAAAVRPIGKGPPRAGPLDWRPSSLGIDEKRAAMMIAQGAANIELSQP